MRQTSRDPRAESIRNYVNDAAELREQARVARRDGFMAWFYELTGLAAIVERAAQAEMHDRPPVER